MKLNTLFQALLLMTAILILHACGQEPGSEKALLYGKWELKEASRNGSPTESLAGLYYEFLENDSMDTNLPLAPGKSMYELDGNSLRQAAGPDEIEYTIESLDESNLVLATVLRNTNFRFVLQKQPSQ
ncbi:MAG: lipocalin family protein [Lewinellaceae bacterium]|nr:lipocalin family protein [Lewinellaceae bacterium]